MHSPHGKLLVFGDSNVGMFKQLFDADGVLMGYSTVEFWYQTGAAFNTVRIGDGTITGRGKDSLPPVSLSDFDHILWAGGRLRTMPVFEALQSVPPGVWSDSFIQESTQEYLLTLPGVKNLAALRASFDKQITVVTTPLRGAGHGVVGVTEPDAEHWRIHDLIWKSYENTIQAESTHLIRIPRFMLTEGYLVKECYCLADDDDLHKNISYARDLLNEIATRHDQ